ncbi:MAG TPA: GTP cyclohydrolase II [Hypericibacter adhaerens]|uniref:GTP cyclohydrolase II n=1 Tax=Hypericibacter adhaerens TaxID=2602016 RepID=UPI002B5E18A2|nr:GTP cyclohydrolase II [Hypericibacter adhaerens]HWA42050.1 GTP cyclohydrolase II [Hypericibacter adhaerens]
MTEPVLDQSRNAAASELSAAAAIAVDRATTEFRRGQPVLILGPQAACLAAAAETVALAGLRRLRQAGPALLVLTGRRAAVLGLAASQGVPTPANLEAPNERPFLVSLPAGADAEAVLRLADPTAVTAALAPDLPPPPFPDELAAASIHLAKLARLLPAAVVSALPPRSAEEHLRMAAAEGILAVRSGDVAAYETTAAVTLQPVGEARVPMEGAEDARIVAFRPSDGSTEHLAIIIGQPDPAKPALARLHSECFTGDLLGSLRCDCGEQLRGAIAEIERQGGGILLYLAQEGRGIGLVNKLRAYRLQDQGADTADANEQLGFEADERIYLAAAEMLRRLGFKTVRLMTNNPDKVAGLERLGIAVAERVPLVIPANRFNRDYLTTKARKFGHMF